VTLTQICSFSYSYFFTKLEVSTAFLFRENQRHGTDGGLQSNSALRRRHLTVLLQLSSAKKERAVKLAVDFDFVNYLLYYLQRQL